MIASITCAYSTNLQDLSFAKSVRGAERKKKYYKCFFLNERAAKPRITPRGKPEGIAPCALVCHSLT